MPHPTIHIGSTGPEVMLAQEALDKRGYSPGPLDGLFGPQTKPATGATDSQSASRRKCR